jgi:hypothetical protein
MLTCLNPLAIHIYSLACLLWYSSLVEYDMCSRLFIYCIYTTRIAAQTWRLMMSSRRACHQSAACGVPFWRSAASCSLWCYVVETLGHVMVLILSFTLWHCIWYSLSHYVCVTWSWPTCNSCIRVCLQIRVWQYYNQYMTESLINVSSEQTTSSGSLEWNSIGNWLVARTPITHQQSSSLSSNPGLCRCNK